MCFAKLLVIVNLSGCDQEPPPFVHWTGMHVHAELTTSETDVLDPAIRDLYVSLCKSNIIGRSATDFRVALTRAAEVRTHSRRTGYGYFVRRGASGASEGNVYFGVLVSDDTGKIIGAFSYELCD
jgi:hypothetical protein